jgi:polysaccharide export outer membrane protein
MQVGSRGVAREVRFLWQCVAVLAVLATTMFAQGGQPQSQTQPAMPPSPTQLQDYTVGPGDVVDITVLGAPEFTGKYRITDTGKLAFPELAEPVQAEGLSPQALGKRIGEALKAAEMMQDPIVSVFVEEFHSRTVTILGAVSKPAVYPLTRPRTTLLDVLSDAGGLMPTAGGNILVEHRIPQVTGEEKLSPEEQEFMAGNRVQTIGMAKLIGQGDSSLNVGISPGDVVTVGTAPIVYVVGAVIQPGGYALPDPMGRITVLKAVALAKGLTPVAGQKHASILRLTPDGKEQPPIPLDLSQLMQGKGKDQFLEANDVLFVPESTQKKSMQKFGLAAQALVNGVAIYGLGYRVAGIK